jgi:hypothetical protein
MFVRRAVALVGLVLWLVPAMLCAQTRRPGQTSFLQTISAGLRAGRDFENHAWSLGGQASVPIGKNLELRPSGDYFFPKEGENGWQLNGDAIFKSGALYGGGGVAYAHTNGSGESNSGYNLFFGLSATASSGRSKPFIEFRWTMINDTSPFRLALGFNYQLFQ